ncbi:unnamed protein product [Miscanthus lutarioriparius]|uniref:Reverse transcriptase/retrotransposon-derived protein RNase H-like domain-containing protein n=1 Tax=Miscanthus lutarioriparius TaxID=422564 RepID=A0A811N308_9POAL|nr:unnamed protein product [Miscanthus lutarioriparius]
MEPNLKLVLEEIQKLKEEFGRRFDEHNEQWERRFADLKLSRAAHDAAVDKRLDSIELAGADTAYTIGRRVADLEAVRIDPLQDERDDRVTALEVAATDLGTWRPEMEALVDDLRIEMQKLYQGRDFKEEVAGQAGAQSSFRSSTPVEWSSKPTPWTAQPLPPPPPRIDKPVAKPAAAEPTATSSAAGALAAVKAYHRALGLCYKCNAKWSKDHRCAPEVLHAVDALWESLDPDVVPATEHSDDHPPEQVFLAISKSAMSGVPAARTIRLLGSMSGIPVHILVDSGSSSSFISNTTAAKLHHPDSVSMSSCVQVAGGGVLQSSLLLRQVTWTVGSCSFRTDFRVLPLGNFDAILGMDWLEAYSPMQVHWALKWLAVPYADKTQVLQGLPFHIETDAFGSGIGAVLQQNGHPIAFISKALSPRNQGLSVYEKEYLAILMAVEQWRHYLLQVSHNWLDEVVQGYYFDQAAMDLLSQLAASPDSRPPFSLIQGVIRYKNRLWLSSNKSMQLKIMISLHSSPLGGHSGAPATYMPELHKWMADRELMHTVVKQHLLRAQARMKRQADKGRSERQFSVGDMVFLKLQPYIQSSLFHHSNNKLSFKFFGPFQVIQKICLVAYKSAIATTLHSVHPVFHVS